mmetsp:Transcript_21222/g.29734  ORF Transcript_21222/g.29734 Transcript_21222/m.29734 type:complete len:759 (+) Transcript_21222:108-2384(+)
MDRTKENKVHHLSSLSGNPDSGDVKSMNSHLTRLESDASLTDDIPSSKECKYEKSFRSENSFENKNVSEGFRKHTEIIHEGGEKDSGTVTPQTLKIELINSETHGMNEQTTPFGADIMSRNNEPLEPSAGRSIVAIKTSTPEESSRELVTNLEISSTAPKMDKKVLVAPTLVPLASPVNPDPYLASRIDPEDDEVKKHHYSNGLISQQDIHASSSYQKLAFNQSNYNATPLRGPRIHPASSRVANNRTTIHLHLVEEKEINRKEIASYTPNFQFLRRLRRSERLVRSMSESHSTNRNVNSRNELDSIEEQRNDLQYSDDSSFFLTTKPKYSLLDRGNISISWYNGTSTSEVQEHVLQSVRRKLSIDSKSILINLTLIDEQVEPHEEIVLSKHIPDGSKFLLKFSLTEHVEDKNPEQNLIPNYDGLGLNAPDSPSAAPSPKKPILSEEVKNELGIIIELEKKLAQEKTKLNHTEQQKDLPLLPEFLQTSPMVSSRPVVKPRLAKSNSFNNDADYSTSYQHRLPKAESTKEGVSPKNDVVAEHLQQLNDLLMRANEKLAEDDLKRKTLSMQYDGEKRQTIFVIANFLVLFLSIVAISAEIHERAPRWINWINENVASVQNCSANRDALFECVSSGDFSGLIASIFLWATKSVTTRQIFLFGFDSTLKLWTVVYEAGISAICWGTSYLFIRRGLNVNTRANFIKLYWKDAVHGSLAAFSAAFMKAVLKNMIPQDQVLDVFEHRQLRIIKFIGHLFRGHDGA